MRYISLFWIFAIIFNQDEAKSAPQKTRTVCSHKWRLKSRAGEVEVERSRDLSYRGVTFLTGLVGILAVLAKQSFCCLSLGLVTWWWVHFTVFRKWADKEGFWRVSLPSQPSCGWTAQEDNGFLCNWKQNCLYLGQAFLNSQEKREGKGQKSKIRSKFFLKSVYIDCTK
jgi:hypothetical protein